MNFIAYTVYSSKTISMKITASVTCFIACAALAQGQNQQMSSININVQTNQAVNDNMDVNTQMAFSNYSQLSNVSQNPGNSFYMNGNEQTNIEQPVTQVQTRNRTVSRNRNNTRNATVNTNPVLIDNVEDDVNDNVSKESNLNKTVQKREKLVYTPPPTVEYNLSNRIPQAKGTGNGSKQMHRSGIGKFFYKLGKNIHKSFTKGPRRHHRSRCPQWRGKV